MKRSYAISLVILAAMAGLGWRNQQRLATARDLNSRLLTESIAQGLIPDPSHPGETTAPARRRPSQSKVTSAEYIAFLKEWRAKGKDSGYDARHDPEFMKQIAAFMDRISALSADEVQKFLDDLRTTNELDEESRTEAITLSLMALSNHQPQAVLRSLIDSADLLPDASQRKRIAAAALTYWGKTDPLAAAQWVKDQSEKNPDLVNDEVTCSLLASAATQDPKLAFQVFSGFKFKERGQALSAMMSAAKTPADRTNLLGGLRDYVATLQQPKAQATIFRALSSLADDVAQDGFQNATQWVDSAKLTPDELQAFGQGLSYSTIKPADAAQWVEWLGTHLSSDRAPQQVAYLVTEWTCKDHQAAGIWLTQTPEGPTKRMAVRAFAEAVAPYDPETAGQWAMTLPAGSERDDSLRKIYKQWPKNDAADKAAADAFATKHGIAP